jgi:alkanesulfonate monooxygenase SsuD/methylene tetrahydromethanopterin reductase-like flavin-dependent oxidoreductase (luciferase family)
MELALMTEPQIGGSYEQLLAAVRWAEAAGMRSFARSDHYGNADGRSAPTTDAFVSLGGLARETDRIRLGILVSPITFRHPAVIAKSAATIDEMSDGRLDLGIGTGWQEHEHSAFGLGFPPTGERFDLLEEALGYVSAAFDGGSFHGERFNFTGDAEPRPRGVRLMVGGGGPRRTPTLAGRYADEFNHGLAPADEIAPKIATMRAAAEEAGRNPEAITVSVMGPVITGADPSAYRTVLEATASAVGRPPERIEERWKAAGLPVGPPDEVRETIASLERVGVEKLYVQHLDLSDLAPLEAVFSVLEG